MRWENVLAFKISLRETFLKSVSLTVMKKKWWKCCNADFTSDWDPLTCGLSKGVLKRRFLYIGLTKSLTVFSFENT